MTGWSASFNGVISVNPARPRLAGLAQSCNRPSSRFFPRKQMYRSLGLDSDQFLFLFREFKRLALCLLDQCFRTNEELTQQLLTYNLQNWGGQTCLSLAISIEHEEFLAHVSCQTLLTDIWTGAMKTAHRSSIKVSV